MQTHPNIEKEQPVFFSDFLGEMETMKPFLDLQTQMYATSLRVIKEFGTKEMYERAQAFDKIREEKTFGCMKASGKFTPICHGDAWYNNMMFKFEGDDPVKMIMLDFQIYIFGIPCEQKKITFSGGA